VEKITLVLYVSEIPGSVVVKRPLSEVRFTVRFGVFTAVTMKNAVCWDIKTQFVLHRRHTFSAAEPSQIRFEVFTAVTMKNAVF
jgi:hypothetical protein